MPPPQHELDGYAAAWWEKQKLAVDKRLESLSMVAWQLAASAPQKDRILDFRLHFGDNTDEPPRFRVTSFLDPAHTALLKDVFEFCSTHALPLLDVCACHGPGGQCGERHKAPRHCKAVQLAHNEWLLPLRGRIGDEEAEWPEILRDRCFPTDKSEPTFLMPPAAMMLEVAQPPAADEDACRQLYRRIPKGLRETLEAFQVDSVRFALRRGGRVLLADEMGLGKSLQALAIAAAYRGNSAGADKFWPLLIVCPTSMRDVWVSLVERWIPNVPCEEICVLRRQTDMVTRREVTIASYKIAHEYLREPLKARHARDPFKCIILDESHNVQYYTREQRKPGSWSKRTGGKGGGTGGGGRGGGGGGGGSGRAAPAPPECRFESLSALCSLPEAEQKVILLSGTPMRQQAASLYGQLHLLRPSIFGTYDAFGERYCKEQDPVRKVWWGDHSQRRDEMNGFLSAHLMVRRLKSDVMGEQLKPIRREVVQVEVGPSDAGSATAVRKALEHLAAKYHAARSAERPNAQSIRIHRAKFWQATGLAKAGMTKAEIESHLGFKTIDKPRGGERDDDDGHETPNAVKWLRDAILNMARPPYGKMIIFAHHIAVLNACQRMLDEMRDEASKAFGSANGSSFFVRADGSTSVDRTERLNQFESDDTVRVALLGLTAFSQGVTLNAASTIVFLELYSDWNELAQAESRCHRRGQERQVSAFYLNAKHSFDELLWPLLMAQKERTAAIIDHDATADGAGPSAAGEAHAEAEEAAEEAASRPKRRRTVTITRLLPSQEEGGAHGDADAAAGVGSSMEVVTDDETAKLLDATFAQDDDVTASRAQAEEELREVRAGVIHELRVRGQVAFWPSPWSDRAYLYQLGEGSTVAAHSYIGVSIDTSKLAAPDEQRDSQKLRPYRLQVRQFELEWAALSQGQRTALCEWAGRQARPLSLPLSAESEALGAAAASRPHSTRRYAHVSQFGPRADAPDARIIEWRMAKGKDGQPPEPKQWTVRRHPTAWDTDWLCLYCDGERDSSGVRCEKEAPFCSTGCMHAYDLRVGTASAPRKVCFDRDRGVCVRCGLDCHALYLRLKPLTAERRRQVLNEAFGDTSGGRQVTGPQFEGIVKRCWPGSIWQADHKKAVANGGGEATTAGEFQTLCTACHHEKGHKDRQERKARKAGEAAAAGEAQMDGELEDDDAEAEVQDEGSDNEAELGWSWGDHEMDMEEDYSYWDDDESGAEAGVEVPAVISLSDSDDGQ